MAKKQTKKNITDTPKTEDELKIESTRALYNYLYEACNILRGPISQDSFKDYVTPLLYYKRISDVHDKERMREVFDQQWETLHMPTVHSSYTA